eukprot:8773710-Pyramimonas_sp.AAC.2
MPLRAPLLHEASSSTWGGARFRKSVSSYARTIGTATSAEGRHTPSTLYSKVKESAPTTSRCSVILQSSTGAVHSGMWRTQYFPPGTGLSVQPVKKPVPRAASQIRPPSRALQIGVCTHHFPSNTRQRRRDVSGHACAAASLWNAVRITATRGWKSFETWCGRNAHLKSAASTGLASIRQVEAQTRSATSVLARKC